MRPVSAGRTWLQSSDSAQLRLRRRELAGTDELDQLFQEAVDAFNKGDAPLKLALVAMNDAEQHVIIGKLERDLRLGDGGAGPSIRSPTR